jgi:hypothetical protein
MSKAIGSVTEVLLALYARAVVRDRDSGIRTRGFRKRWGIRRFDRLRVLDVGAQSVGISVTQAESHAT